MGRSLYLPPWGRGREPRGFPPHARPKCVVETSILPRPGDIQYLPTLTFSVPRPEVGCGLTNWWLEAPGLALPALTSAGSVLQSQLPFPYCTRWQPVPGRRGLRTTTMAAATLLRATPLFSGERGGEGDRGPRARGGRQEGPGSDPRALTPNLCPGRSRRRPDPTAAGPVAAAEGPGPVPLVPRPGRGG